MKCFGELQKVNRQANVKHQEIQELDIKCIIYKVCVYLYVCIYTCTFHLRFGSGYMCTQNIKPKALFFFSNGYKSR